MKDMYLPDISQQFLMQAFINLVESTSLGEASKIYKDIVIMTYVQVLTPAVKACVCIWLVRLFEMENDRQPLNPKAHPAKWPVG